MSCHTQRRFHDPPCGWHETAGLVIQTTEYTEYTEQVPLRRRDEHRDTKTQRHRAVASLSVYSVVPLSLAPVEGDGIGRRVFRHKKACDDPFIPGGEWQIARLGFQFGAGVLRLGGG